MTVRRLLAVTHELTRTGAPTNLLHFLRWITAHAGVEVETLALRDGPLRAAFASVGDVTVLDLGPVAKLGAIADRTITHFRVDRLARPVEMLHLRPQLRRLRGFDVVYLNSITSAVVGRHLRPAPLTVSHVHELRVALRMLRMAERSALRNRPDLWIAASDPVRSALVDELAVPDTQVRVHPEFIDVRSLTQRPVDARAAQVRRRELRIPSDAAVVLGAGAIHWRKGVDLFVQLACEVRRRTRHPVHFVWMGGPCAGLEWERTCSEKDRSGADHVHFVDEQADPVGWFQMADVLAVTSREDPLPLVGLEAAALGVPVATYRNGGLPDVLEAAGPHAARGVADHLHVEGLASSVLTFLHNERLREAAITELGRRVLDHHDVGHAAPRLLAELERAAAAPRRRRGRGVPPQA